MIGRFATVILVCSWLPDCKGVGEPGSFEKFIAREADPGSEEMCSSANDGKRFWLEGYLQLPSSFSISSGKTNLAFYARIDGNGRGSGRSIRVNVTAPGDIDDLWMSATGKKTVGFPQRAGADRPRCATHPRSEWRCNCARQDQV